MVRRAGLLWLGLAILATAWAFHYLALDFGGLLGGSAWASMREYAAGFLQPELSRSHLQRVGWALLETLAMSAMGTLLAMLFGLALALVANETSKVRRFRLLIPNNMGESARLRWSSTASCTSTRTSIPRLSAC